MPDSTNPGDIWVVGQRRAPGGAFPSAGGSGSGDHGNDGTHSNQDEGEQPGLETPFNPCAQPSTALEWNTDAAAAEAAKQMAQAAANQTPPEDLNTREWGAYLYRAGDGSIHVGPVSHGDPFSFGGNGEVRLELGNFDPSQIVGAVHSHSVGNHLPSPTGPDGRGDLRALEGLADYAGNNDVRYYIVAQNTGPEVNPEGTPCP